MRAAYLILIGFLAFGCQSKTDDSWDVLVVGLPDEVSPTTSHFNVVSYILKQSHEPIFRNESGSSLSSNLLARWERSSDNKFYSLCIKEDLSFDSSTKFKVSDLILALQRLKLGPQKITQDGSSCIKIFFSQSQPNFFDSLMSYTYAPSRSVKGTKYSMGLGSFAIVSYDAGELRLERKIRTKAGFNKIRFLTESKFISLITEAPLTIEDYNLIPLEQVPKAAIEKYSKYPVSLLKLYGLVLNIEDLKFRKAIFNCLDIDGLRESYFPAKQFLDIGSVFPIGISGAIPKKVSQNCPLMGSSEFKSPLVFANWKQDQAGALNKYFHNVKTKIGLNISVLNLDPSKLSNMILKTRKGYDLVILALDTDQEEYVPFFENLIPIEKRFHKVHIPHLLREFKKMKTLSSRAEIKLSAQQLNQLVLDQAIFLPLFQDQRNYYFPEDIQNLQLGTNFLGYMEIGHLSR